MFGGARISAAISVAVLLACLSAAPVSADDSVRMRKDVLAMTAQEKERLVDAILELKRTPSPYPAPSYLEEYEDAQLSWYDQFVLWHVYLSKCDAMDPVSEGDRQWGHAGPMFLPWHREYLLLFEDALRAVSGEDITVPYWDWTNGDSVDAVFSPDFMGGDGDPNAGHAVTDGPFNKTDWRFVVGNHGLSWATSNLPYIVRQFGSTGDVLPTDADVAATLAVEQYDSAPYNDRSDPATSFRNAIEGWRGARTPILCGPDGWLTVPTNDSHATHNVVHIWTGGFGGPSQDVGTVFGTMTVPVASPNDPVFFLHHSNVDRLWDAWQRDHGKDTYVPRSGLAENEADAVMEPFGFDGIKSTPDSVADAAELGYSYAPPARARRSLRGPRRTDRLCRVGRQAW